MEIFLPSKSLATLFSQDEGESILTKGSVLRAKVLGYSTESGLTTLKVGLKVIQAQLSSSLEPGREVRLLVEQTTPKLKLTMVEDQEKTDKSTPAPARRQGPSLRQNQILAKVLDIPEKGKIKLSITSAPSLPGSAKTSLLGSGVEIAPGREVTATLAQSSGLNLQPGQELKFNVTDGFARLVLQLAPDQDVSRPPLAQALASFLAEPAKLPEGAGELLSLIEPQSDPATFIDRQVQSLHDLTTALSPQPGKTDHEFMNRLVEIMGLRGEKSPVQLAAARLWTSALDLPNLEELKNNPKLLKIMETAAKVFEAIGQVQDLNRETIAQNQTLHLAFPIFWPNENGRGEILASWEQEQDKAPSSSKSLRVSLLLDLSRLGKTKIDIELKGKRARGAILTETRAARQAVSSRLDELKTSLEARGFEITALTVETYPPQTRPPETLAAELLPQGRGLVDVKV